MTGHLQKLYEVDQTDLIGKGGFGLVFKATDKNTDKVYAIKKTRLHLPLRQDDSDNLNLREELKRHKVFRELQIMTTCADAELQNVVRWYGYWLEDVTTNEISEERELLERYKNKRQ